MEVNWWAENKCRSSCLPLSYVEGKNVFKDINTIHHLCVTITHSPSIHQISYRAPPIIIFTDRSCCPNRKYHILLYFIKVLSTNAARKEDVFRWLTRLVWTILDSFHSFEQDQSTNNLGAKML